MKEHDMDNTDSNKEKDFLEISKLPLENLLSQGEVIPMKLFLFLLAQSVLQEEPDIYAIKLVKAILIEMGFEENHVTYEAIKDFARDIIELLQDKETAINQSKHFLHTSEILGDELWEIKRQLEKMPVGQLKAMIKLDSLNSKKPTGPKFSEKREERAKLFRSIKDQNPKLSQVDLASKATQLMYNKMTSELKQNNPNWSSAEIMTEATVRFPDKGGKNAFSVHDVRNDYRDKGWHWERADRIR